MEGIFFLVCVCVSLRCRYFLRAKQTLAELNEKKDDRLEPLDDSICGSTSRNEKRVAEWRRRGLEKISRGEVGVLLLAGKVRRSIL